MINTTSPKSGWLNKLTTNNTFGASRWQARYFVLLDSELRYYKDEHTATASRTINLRDISKVIKTEYVNRPYCFKLEPTLYYQNQHPTMTKNHKKIWTMQCKSEYELQSWIAAINMRLAKLCFDEEDTISTLIQSVSISDQKQQSSLDLLCTNMADSSRPLDAPSISRRRGVILSPLDVCTMPCLESSDMLSSSSSKGSEIPSPIRSVTIEDDDDIDETMNGHADKLTSHNAYVLNTSSPTFALYKERFHL